MTAANNNRPLQKSDDEARLKAVLEAYGRNPLRWPEADRVRFAGLLRNPELLPAELSAEADILDKLLDSATAASIAEPQGARDRLLAAVRSPATTMHPAPASTHRPWREFGIMPQQLLVAGTLAASVMLGVFAGINTDAGGVLADSLRLPASTDDVLDVVLLEDGDDEGLL